jgi:redox-sensing transcriptional repressor
MASPKVYVGKIPERAVTRLSIYLRCLEDLQADGVRTISSKKLAERFGLNSAQVRKDLAYFGQFGVRGLGYSVRDLKHSLEQILGLKRDWEVALVGVGHLGSALAGYARFTEQGFRIALGFDKDPERCGTTIGTMPVLAMDQLVSTLRRRKIRIAIMATPAAAAQEVADLLVQAGVTSILNFAPSQLVVPDGVKVQNVDLSVLLKTLSFHTARAGRRTAR